MTSVLVLDDRASDRDLLTTVLGYAGFSTLEASTGAIALALAHTERPDLIVSDILMPDMDGYEFVNLLRRDGELSDIPVLFCTASYNIDEVRRLAQGCGVSHILVKPCEPEEIARVVGEALSDRSRSVPPAAAAQFDREHLRVVNRKLIENVSELDASNHELERLHEELRSLQRQTAESLALLEALQSTAPVGFGFMDCDFRMLRMNETLAAVNGVPLAEQLGRTVAEVVPELWPQLEPLYRQVLDTGEAVVNQEVQGEAPSAPAAVHSWLASYYPVRLDGEIIGLGIVVVDITERKESQNFRSVVLENMAEGLCVMDGNGRLVLMNTAASKLLGFTQEELVGLPVHDAIHYQHADGSPHHAKDCKIFKAQQAGEPVQVSDDLFIRKDGTPFPVAYSASPLTSGFGGNGVVVVFRDTTDEQAERTRVRRELDALTWVGRTRDALEEDRLVLYSQPIVPLGHGESSQELLLRMIGRDGQVVPPGTFLPVAEKYGLIAEIDKWVVTKAIGIASEGRCLHANLSAESIGSAELLSLIETQLSETGADPAKIIFEITETALMRDIDAGEAFAHRLVDLGCQLALDDFGTGFGSFTYLKRLPITHIKIDIEFVRALPTTPANQHLVKAIVNLAQGFGHKTIAEGVETEQTLELLRQYGVDFAQGYYIGRPTPLLASGEVSPATE